MTPVVEKISSSACNNHRNVEIVAELHEIVMKSTGERNVIGFGVYSDEEEEKRCNQKENFSVCVCVEMCGGKNEDEATACHCVRTMMNLIMSSGIVFGCVCLCTRR
jgi:hypothetical protein